MRGHGRDRHDAVRYFEAVDIGLMLLPSAIVFTTGSEIALTIATISSITGSDVQSLTSGTNRRTT